MPWENWNTFRGKQDKMSFDLIDLIPNKTFSWLLLYTETHKGYLNYPR